MVTWEELLSNGINVKTISRGSDEYQLMWDAAVAKVPSAEYCFALWQLAVNENKEAAQTWMKRSASQNYQPAVEAYAKMENGEEIEIVSPFSTDSTPNEQSENALKFLFMKGLTKGLHNMLYDDQQNSSESTETTYEQRVADEEDIATHEDEVIASESGALVIKKHDFQVAKNTLKKYTEQSRDDIALSRVPTEGGLFNLGNHKVTGEELNKITSQIQNYLISINNLSQGIIDEFGEVYKAFEALDKDYISGIVLAIKSAEAVSKDEQKDRADIKKLVSQHSQSVEVLKKFKEKIEKLEHLTDIDKAWELIEGQAKLLKECREYIAGLSKLKHIGEVDLLWEQNESLAKGTKALMETVEKHSQALSDFRELLQRVQEAQRQFINEANQLFSKTRDELLKQVESFTTAQTQKLDEIDRNYSNSIESLSKKQKEVLSTIEKSLFDKLDLAISNHTDILNRIETTQKDELKKMAESQSSTLGKMSQEQTEKLAQINQSLEDEKALLNEQVSSLSTKVKYLYYVAGGAAAITIIQLILNIFGVI